MALQELAEEDLAQEPCPQGGEHPAPPLGSAEELVLVSEVVQMLWLFVQSRPTQILCITEAEIHSMLDEPRALGYHAEISIKRGTGLVTRNLLVQKAKEYVV